MNQPLVSVVVTSYNRASLLQRTVDAFRRCCTYPHLEWLLTDDGSRVDQRQRMFDIGFDRLFFAGRNEGLGANLNKGLLAARGGYILHLEDDWTCQKKMNFIEQAIEIMQAHPDIGYV